MCLIKMPERNFKPQFKKIIESINSNDNIFLITHEKPDGDAIGSLLAMFLALENFKKKVIPFCADPLPKAFSFLPKSKTIKQDIKFQNQNIVIFLDCQNFKRAGIEQKKIKTYNTLKKSVVIVIDHHPDENNFSNINIIEPKFSATAEILFNFFETAKIEINKDIATCLLTGIITDTGGFQHSNTSPKTMRIAATLLSKGASLNKIIKNTFQNKTLPSLKICGKALERVKIDQKTKAAVSFLSKKDLEECGANLDDLSGVSNMISAIPETKFSLLLTEYSPGKISGSLRSEKYKGTDVSQIARKLNGGGHKLAAGFEIDGKTEDAFAIVNEKILGKNC